MKKLKLFFALFAMLALNVGNAWGAEATVYTSNVELSITGGTKATASKAKISNVDYSAMKLGSSGNAGNFYVNLPANTTSLTLHAAAWNGKNSNKLTLSSETAGVTISPSTAQTLTANSGVSGNSTTYTITPNNTTEFFTFTLTGATSGAKIKLACTERCLIWGVNAETAASGETPGEGEEPTPDPGNGETYKLITSTSELEVGTKYVIGNASSSSAVFMSNATNTNNRKETASITITDSQISATDEVLVLELGGTTGAWTFWTTNYTSTNGYLTSAATGSNNYCKVTTPAVACSYFTISFTDGAAVITSTGRNERNLLRYNSSSNCFACYSSGQSPVYLYKLTTSSGGDEGGTEQPVDSLTAK